MNICYDENTAITLSKIYLILSWVGILDYFSCYHILFKKMFKKKRKKCDAGLMTSRDHVWSCSSGHTSMDLSCMRWEEIGGGRRGWVGIVHALQHGQARTFVSSLCSASPPVPLFVTIKTMGAFLEQKSSYWFFKHFFDLFYFLDKTSFEKASFSKAESL